MVGGEVGESGVLGIGVGGDGNGGVFHGRSAVMFFDFKGVSMQVVVAGSGILLVGGKQCWSGILARIGGKNFLVNLFVHI